MFEYKKDNFNDKETLRDIQVIRMFPIVGDSPAKVFLYKKSERLSVVLHMISNHIKDTEPTKFEVRDSAIGIVRNVLKLNRSTEIDRKELIASIGEAVLRAQSALESLLHIGLVSLGNVVLIKRELSFLVQLAEGHIHSANDSDSVDPGVFNIPTANNAVRGKKQVAPNLSSSPKLKDEVVQYSGFSDGVNVSSGRDKSVSKRQDYGPKGQNIYKGQDDIKDNRSSAIINLLKTQSNLSVKDFVKVISGVSEKTIQRELISLLMKGVLTKTGSKRWTRYSLSSIKGV